MHINTFRNFLSFEKRFSPHTVQAYIADVEQFCAYLEDVYAIDQPEAIQPVHIRSWMVYQLDSGITPRSVNRKLSSLRSWFKVLRRQELVTSNPFSRITGPKSGKSLPNVIDNNRLRNLFDETHFPEGFAGLRDRLLLELLYSCGLRRSELIGLEFGDIDFHRKVIKVEGKGRKQRFVPVMPQVLELIGKYREARRGFFESDQDEQRLIVTDKGKPLYPKYVYNIVTKYLSTITNSKSKSPHALRHAFATHLAENGADINAIKELLGHTSLAATQVYMHTSAARLKAAYDQAHPKA